MRVTMEIDENYISAFANAETIRVEFQVDELREAIRQSSTFVVNVLPWYFMVLVQVEPKKDT